MHADQPRRSARSGETWLPKNYLSFKIILGPTYQLSNGCKKNSPKYFFVKICCVVEERLLYMLVPKSSRGQLIPGWALLFRHTLRLYGLRVGKPAGPRILKYPSYQNKLNLDSHLHKMVLFSLELTIPFLLFFCLFVILVAMATVYRQWYANKLPHVKRVSISFHKMYGLLYLSQTVYLLYLIISGHQQTTEN